VRPTVTTEAVLLRSVPYREADLVVTLWSRERGKLSAIARHVRASKRRFGGGLGLFAVGRAQLAGARKGELWDLVAFDVVRDFSRLAVDVASTAHASYGTELVRELTVPGQADAAIFDLLVELYAVLAERGPVPAVLRSFELKLLGEVGLAPSLDRCVGCGEEAAERLDEPGVGFDGARGGVVCPACAVGPDTRPLPAAARAVLLAARAAPALGAVDAATAPVGSSGLEARDAILGMILGHLGKPLKSVEFIAKVSGALRARPR
jgi:DNA repair protein RecO (recombination protein O)